MANLEVHILSRKLIKPSLPTPNHLHHFQLSLLDQLAPPMYVHVLFYFLHDEDSGSRAKKDERCGQLETSLSQVLTKFYPLAGRFVKDDLLIQCSDQGAEYFEAGVSAELEDLLQKQPETDVLSKFLPWDHPPPANLVTSPLLAIQINTFDCGGFVLGMRVSHIVADAFTMMTFIKEWASCSCSTDLKESNHANRLTSCNNLVSLFPTRILTGLKFPPPAGNLGRLVTRAFLFDENAIAKMAKAASGKNLHPTRVVVVLALIWKALLGASFKKHGQTRDSIVVLPINLRGKTALAMAEPFCGNFWIPVLVRLEAKGKDRIQLEELMILVQETIKSSSEELGSASADDISTTLINSRREVTEKRHFCADSVDIFVCTSWCRLPPMYEVDFGWGKPSWVGQGNKSLEGVALLDAKNGNGIEAWISLKEKDMIEFNQQLQSTMSVRPK